MDAVAVFAGQIDGGSRTQRRTALLRVQTDLGDAEQIGRE